jgi:hypothetical protein
VQVEQMRQQVAELATAVDLLSQQVPYPRSADATAGCGYR